ncbi:receptor-interacting serine/threonine-protein kinase 4-like [Zophobas morio]|uniref:receptor-interacting serine/threonine-protein kinase 4-like n=1 Tax=Zophobas morio TaxID=2755281 RepID=UPI0030838390
MLEQNQIELAWDGLDEASDATQASIMALVKAFSERGVKQWLTSRNNLKNNLEKTLLTFSRNIMQFNEEEQRSYIRDRLQIPEDKLIETFSKIRENIMAYPNYEILGIPLQIYMLTELFSKDLNKYLNLLGGNFTVLKLYNHFVKEKFNVLYAEKKEFCLSNESNYQHFVNEKEKNPINVKCNLDEEVKTFLNKIKNEGDEVGIISRVNSNNEVEFVHNSFGEYFAALYLSILYKNPSILGELTDADLKEKDFIGRDILEVACAYSKNYPVSKNDTVLTKSDFNEDWTMYNSINPRSVLGLALYNRSTQILRKLFSKKEDYFEWDFVEYLGDSVMEIDEIFTFMLELQEFQIEVPNLKGQLLIHYACENRLIKTLSLLLVKSPNVDVRDRSGRLPIQYACEHGDLESVELLVRNGAKLNVSDENGLLLIHYACKNWLNGYRIIPFLIEKGVKVDSADGNSRLPIHYASEYGNLDAMKSLVKNGAKVDVPDKNDKKLPIHYAFDKILNADSIVSFLKENGANLNSPDGFGRLPIHYACEYGSLGAVKLLVDNGAKLNVLDGHGAKINSPDHDGRLPIHYACEFGDLDQVMLLKTNGAKVDIPDRNGRLPMHYASKNRFNGHRIMTFLIREGAKAAISLNNSHINAIGDLTNTLVLLDSQ